MQIQHLRTFVTVARSGSFQSAAARLAYSQAAVSAHIAALERDLGGRLLERSRSQLAPTGLGEWLLPRAEVVLAEFDAISCAAVRVTGGDGSRVGALVV